MYISLLLFQPELSINIFMRMLPCLAFCDKVDFGFFPNCSDILTKEHINVKFVKDTVW